MRFIRAAREVGVEQGSPLTTIPLYTDVERDSMFVREADEAERIYSAGRDAYLDYDVHREVASFALVMCPVVSCAACVTSGGH